MKKFFLCLVTLLTVSVASVFAQSSLIATLSHEGEITAFYGQDALIEAHEAAVDGDAITLSSGAFYATNITKAITLRGAGMQVDTINNTLPTILLGGFIISLDSNSTERFAMEGIYHGDKICLKGKLSNAQFYKNRFYKIICNGVTDGILDNCSFIHCKIEYDWVVTSSQTNCMIANSYVNSLRFYNQENSGSMMNFNNCIIDSRASSSLTSKPSASSSDSRIAQLMFCNFYNCIFIGTGLGNPTYSLAYDCLPSTATAYNCVAINCYANKCFYNMSIPTNVSSTQKEVFKNLVDYELTDEAKTKFLGTDGTQVGIYGGPLPFDPTMPSPRIVKCDVAAKSTIDGKLSVDIEVVGAE